MADNDPTNGGRSKIAGGRSVQKSRAVGSAEETGGDDIHGVVFVFVFVLCRVVLCCAVMCSVVLWKRFPRTVGDHVIIGEVT